MVDTQSSDTGERHWPALLEALYRDFPKGAHQYVSRGHLHDIYLAKDTTSGGALVTTLPGDRR
jgi:hypothetical protein